MAQQKSERGVRRQFVNLISAFCYRRDNTATDANHARATAASCACASSLKDLPGGKGPGIYRVVTRRNEVLRS